ncbi:MAG: hypothetical protein JXR26_09535 [Balneolaceae bacterium]|nr:hypothetical protein [Balneolaceae bacterium]
MKTLVIIILVFICVSCSGGNQPAQPQVQVDSLKANLKAAEQVIDSLQQVIDEGQMENPWFNTSIEGRVLLRKGIENPEAYIKQSLREKPDLIPLEPVLGGTMRFANILVLGSQWVIAEYEDGHIMGRTIYEYSIEQNGDIRFTELTSTR